MREGVVYPTGSHWCTLFTGPVSFGWLAYESAYVTFFFFQYYGNKFPLKGLSTFSDSCIIERKVKKYILLKGVNDVQQL